MKISAYLARWGHVSTDESGRRVRAVPTSFDRWLATRSTLPIVLNHGFHIDPERRDDRPPVLGQAFGTWLTFERDDVGLLSHGEIDEEGSFLGSKTAAELRSAELTACSFHGQIFESREASDGVFDMLDARLVEGGPTYDPDDAGALVVELDGVPVRSASPRGSQTRSQAEDFELRDDLPAEDELRRLDAHDLGGVIADFLADVEKMTGITADSVADRQRHRDDLAREQVRRAERCASMLAKTRQEADLSYGYWRSRHSSAEDWANYRRLTAEAEEHDAALRELCYHDDEIYRQLCARYRVPRKDNLVRRMTGRA